MPLDTSNAMILFTPLQQANKRTIQTISTQWIAQHNATLCQSYKNYMFQLNYLSCSIICFSKTSATSFV